jgi:hydrogenase maturation protease
MQLPRLLSNTECKHALSKSPQGVALITVGKSLRGDNGIAAALSRCLPEHLSKKVCRFNLGSYTGFLEDCLNCHKATIIIDSTSNGTTPGTVSILDISHILDQTALLNRRTCHGFSFDRELQLAKKRDRKEGLPARVIFFGVEIDETDWNEELSVALEAKLPKLVSRLSFLVARVVETLIS